jgi:hypothetical protein
MEAAKDRAVTESLSPEETARLIALIEQPEPSRPGPRGRATPRSLMEHFLSDNEIWTGRTPGIEVSSLYRLYRLWVERCDPQPPRLAPLRFARQLKVAGFERHGKVQSLGAGRRMRPVRMHQETANRLLAWLKANPDAPEDRNLYNPVYRRGAL